MFFSLPGSNSGSADSLLHSNLALFSISNYTNFYQIGIKAERSFKERVVDHILQGGKGEDSLPGSHQKWAKEDKTVPRQYDKEGFTAD